MSDKINDHPPILLNIESVKQYRFCCPYCGTPMSGEWSSDYDDDTIEETCAECEAEFSIEMNHEIIKTTKDASEEWYQANFDE